MEIECSHLMPLKKCDAVWELIKKGLLTLDGAVVSNFICDYRVPILKTEASGQSVACVGKENPLCPDPEDKL